ncbi:MAG TPA: protease pro-enzyme activation domain-containing protein [Xanthomonadaceae bacterium]
MNAVFAPRRAVGVRRLRAKLALAITAALCAAGAIAAPATSASTMAIAQPVRLHRGDAVVGALPLNQPIHVEVALKLRDRAGLDALIADNARRQVAHTAMNLLSADDFLAQHAPTQAQAQKVADYLSARGFTNVTIAPNRLLVSADGTAATARDAFMTTFAQVRTRDGRIAHANTDAVRLPAALGDTVLAVLGLQDVHGGEPFAERAANVHPEAGSQGHVPTEFPTIYGSAVPQLRKISVGVVSAGNLKPVLTDLDAFVATFQIPELTRAIRTVGAAGSGTAHVATWDVISQTVAGMSGYAPKVVFYNGPDLTNASLTADYNAAVTLDRVKTVVVGLGECETDANSDGSAAADDAIFQAAIAQGITFVVAAGNQGADECGDGSLAPSWPASSQYVIAVGGTHLFGGVDKRSSERVWIDGGGSPSLFEPMPSWQATLGVPGTTRGVPDLSFDADPNTGALVYVNLALTPVGGTALSSAIFASAWATVDWNNVAGFAAPVVYGIPSTDLHDITLGGNNGETAGPGYDFASGRGSLILDGFFTDANNLKNQRPVASFSITETAPDSAHFTDTSTDDGTIVAHHWDFGDGQGSSATNPSHTYAADGAYHVVETVTDNYGVKDSAQVDFFAGAAQLLANPSFETGAFSPWITNNLRLDNNPADAFDGTYSVLSASSIARGSFRQVVTVPAYKSSVTLTVPVWAQDPGVTPGVTDTLTVEITAPEQGPVLATLATFTNADAGSGYVAHAYDMSAFKGQRVVVQFRYASNDSKVGVTHMKFHVDDVTLTVPP